MSQIISALYPEGSTDVNFYGVLLQRIIDREANRMDDLPLITAVQPKIVRVENKKDRPNAILTAAKKTKGRHLLFVHSDADARKPQKALDKRIKPGLALIAEYREKARDGTDLPIPVPLIPVQATEAWVLADAETLADELEINVQHVNDVIQGDPERFARPKNPLNKIRDKAEGKIGDQDFFQILGQSIRLEKLDVLTSYKQFRKDLRSALDEVLY